MVLVSRESFFQILKLTVLDQKLNKLKIKFDS